MRGIYTSLFHRKETTIPSIFFNFKSLYKLFLMFWVQCCQCLGSKHARLKMSLSFASVFKTMINVYGELPSTEEEFMAENILREQQLSYERNLYFKIDHGISSSTPTYVPLCATRSHGA